MGSTDVATIIGAIVPDMTAFKSPLEVYVSKKETTDSVKDNEAMYWGRALEPVIIDRYEEDTGYRVNRTGQTIYRHPIHEHHTCSPDGLITNSDPKRGLEIKTAGRWAVSDWGPDGSEEIPLPYLVQVMWCMWVTGLQYWDLAALITGSDYRVYHIEANSKLIEMLVEETDRFWKDHVLAGVPPGTEGRTQFKRIQPPVSEGNYILAEQDHLDLAYEYSRIVSEEGELKKRKEEIKIELIAAIGDSSGLMTDGKEEITYRKNKPNEVVDWMACVKELGGTLDNVKRHTTKLEPNRTFRCGVKLGNGAGKDE